MNNKRLLSVILIVFIDLLGFSLILPLLPYYAENYGANGLVIGLLTASYAAAQLVGAPLLGRLSDRFGRRPILLVSILGTALGFVLLGVADPIGRALAARFDPGAANTFVLGMLFFSRILDGLTGGNLSVAQAYISDVTDAKDRSKGLGMIGAAFGFGFIIGPAAGGLLGKISYSLPAFVAAVLAASNLALVYFWLPESLTPEKRAAMPERQPAITLRALLAALRRPFSGSLLITRFFFGMAFAMFQTIFSLYALSKFQFGPEQTGFILTYVGVLSVIVQGFLVGRITKLVREDLLIVLCVALMAVSLLGWAFAPNIYWLLAVLTPTALAGGTLNTVLSSTLTKAVEPQEVGGILGLGAGIESATRVIAPTLGGALMAVYGTGAPGIFCATLLAVLAAYVWVSIRNHPIVERLGTIPAAPVPAAH
jgi:DHA1 family tetracycline resistance protein-like MFS transporter